MYTFDYWTFKVTGHTIAYSEAESRFKVIFCRQEKIVVLKQELKLNPSRIICTLGYTPSGEVQLECTSTGNQRLKL